MTEGTEGNVDVKEHVTTPLNACSLETLQIPISLEDGRLVWPMMLGCYELDESRGFRQGRLDLYTVAVPETGKSPAGFGPPQNVLGGDDGGEPTASLEASGILDGKWYDPPNEKNSSSSGRYHYYATAHASGSIVIHQVQQGEGGSSSSSDAPFQVSQAAKSDPSGNNSLCLSLAWDYSNDASSKDSSSTRIISSYSDGHVAIHNVTLNNNNVNSNNNTVQIEEDHSWAAHKIFRSPAEVWCANFTTNPNVILTGGDDGTVKIWDLRAGTASPRHVLKHFEAGATVLSPHPRREHMVACGSYDESMALLDLRMMVAADENHPPKLLCHTDPLGGGLWRMKWHPLDDDRLLLGAMHGGCRVVKLNGMETADTSSSSTNICKAQVTHKFTKHESMAYGADWLVCQQSAGRTKVEAAASCSFYDRAMYLWEVD
jgi:diphthamide biosynthesis protein 7